MENFKNPKISAAVYARFSSEMQSSSSAIDQVERMKDLVNRNQIRSRMFPAHEIEILAEWIQKDEAVSGRIAGRNGYQTILDGIRHKKFDLLLVDDLSRLTRSLGNLLDLYQLLRHHDVELISVSDQLSSADSNARTFFTVKGMVADFGNEAHAERTLRGMEARARELFSTGQKPYGYGSKPTRKEIRKGKEVWSHYKIFIIPEQAEVIRKIFQLYAEGYGRVHIAKVLNQKKSAPPKNPSKIWRIGPINKILTNEKYTGRWVFKRKTYSFDPDTGKKTVKERPQSEWVVQHSEELRIIPQDLWERVQARLRGNLEARKKYPRNSCKSVFGTKRRIDNLHLLTGLMVCPQCDGTITLVSGKKEGYYGCPEAHRHGTCAFRKLIRREVVEKAVLGYLENQIVSNEEVIRYTTQKYNSLIQEHLNQSPNRREGLESELNAITVELLRLVSFIAQGNVSETIGAAIREREQRKAKILEELSHLSKVDERKFFVTPAFVQKQLSELVRTLAEKGDRYNAVIRDLFEGPLKINHTEGRFLLKGRINLGKAIGSSQCAVASPTGFEPVLPP